MQPNVMALGVDETNSGGNLTPHEYVRFEETQNKTTYIHNVNHTLDGRDKLDLFRTFPTKNGNFRGTAKSALKFTTDISVLGANGVNTVAPLIAEVSFSVPVGTTHEQLLLMRQKLVAILDVDSVMDDLNLRLMV